MNLYNLLNSIDNTLEKSLKNYNNSVINHFIDEIKTNIKKEENIEKLNNLQKDTLFTIDRYEGEFAVCENSETGEMFDIAKHKIDPTAKEGDIIKLEGNMYKIDIEQTKKRWENINAKISNEKNNRNNS